MRVRIFQMRMRRGRGLVWSAWMNERNQRRLSTQRSRGHRRPGAYGITGHEQRSCLSRRTGCVEVVLLFSLDLRPGTECWHPDSLHGVGWRKQQTRRSAKVRR